MELPFKKERPPNSGVISQLIENDPFFVIKLRVMNRFGILPTDQRAKEMTTLQWLLLSKYMDESDRDKTRTTMKLWSMMLGLSTKDGKVMPLSYYIAPEAASQIFGVADDEQIEKMEEAVLSESESERLAEVMKTDIDGLLTDEYRKRMEQMQLGELFKAERLAGIKVGKPPDEE